MADDRLTESRTVRIREGIARISAITVIVVLGVGLTATYSELAQERKAGQTRTEILERLQRDNQDLQGDNDQLRILLAKQSVLIQKLAKGGTVTEAELRDATSLPPSIIIRPGTPGPAGPVGPPGATPRPTPTVEPTPRPTPTPIVRVPDLPVATPSPSPLLCVPLLNMCL